MNKLRWKLIRLLAWKWGVVVFGYDSFVMVKPRGMLEIKEADRA